MHPGKLLDVIERDKPCVSYCEMALHVRKPGVDAGVISHHSVHGTVPLHLNITFFSHPLFRCVRANTFLPLSTHSVKSLLDCDLFHQFLPECLLAFIQGTSGLLTFRLYVVFALVLATA